MRYLFILAAFFVCSFSLFSQAQDTIYLWPGKVPVESSPKHAPSFTVDTASNVTKISDITNPAMLVFTPEKTKSNGACIIVCPGGSYKFLAIDLEGYEVADWLNKLGYTVFVLQYRVPNNREGALCDIQRAMRIVRSKASKWNLDPEKLGVLGFSAGGNLSARASTRYNIESYKKIDAMDTVSCKPDFALLIYPAYLAKGPYYSLTPEIVVDENTPPIFIFSTSDDGAAGSALAMAAGMRKFKLPVEFHFLAEGGHGYGIRPGNAAAETWPFYAEYWLKMNVIKKKTSFKK